MNAVDLFYGLYRRSPIAFQNFMVTAYGSVLHRRRYGEEHDRTLRFLLATHSWSPEQLHQLELDRLCETLLHAQRSVPHYRDLWKKIGFDARDVRTFEDLRQLPVTEKEELRHDPWSFVSEEYHHRQLFKGNTSGTTGKPVVTYKDRGCYQRVWAFQTRQRILWGILGQGRRVSIGVRPVVPMQQCRPPYWRYDRTENSFHFSNFHMSERTLDAYVRQIAEVGPEEINAYPSGAYLVASHALARGEKRIRPRAVVSMAETLYAEQRRVIEEAFGCHVADQYGAAEVVFWVGQCPHGTYHVNPEFGHLESLAGQTPVFDTPGDAVGTGFVNRAQVLIRYRLGDSVILPRESRLCPCGWQTRSLDLIIGRIDDVLCTPDGRSLGRLDIVLKKIDGVMESQLIQDAADHLTVKLVPEVAGSSESETAIRARLSNLFGPAMRIDCEWVTQIPRTAAGKYRYQINLTNKGPASAAGETDRP